MKNGTNRLALAAALLLVGGCQGLKEDLGIGVKRPPDEFTTYSRAPLSMPPDFALRPPANGSSTAASQAAAPRETARQAMVGTGPASSAAASSSGSGSSPGLQALLQRTGATSAQSDIRAQVNRETTILAEADQSFVERLMFWSNTPDPATVVDASQESRRIQENQALNKPLTEGETPTIRRNASGRPATIRRGSARSSACSSTSCSAEVVSMDAPMTRSGSSRSPATPTRAAPSPSIMEI